MKYIHTNRDKTILVDDEDYEHLNQFIWWVDSTGYAAGRPQKAQRQPVRMHTLLIPRPRGTVIDHVNQNRLDNRKQNLRAIPHYLNILNTKSTNVKKRANGRWQSRVTICGVTHSFNCYDTQEEAQLISSKIKQVIFAHYEQFKSLPLDLTAIPEIAQFKAKPATREVLTARAVIGGIASGKVWTEKKLEASRTNLVKADAARQR
jgi:hypothetical protein